MDKLDFIKLYVVMTRRSLQKRKNGFAVRHDSDDEGRWITTENGHKVHINAEGEPDKGNPHVLAEMKKGAPAERSKKDLLPEKTYMDKPSFKKAHDAFVKAWDKKDACMDRIHQIKEELKSESKPKPKEEWDDHDEFLAVIGKQPKILTDKGKELEKEENSLWEEMRGIEEESEKAGRTMQRMKSAAHKKQLEDFHPEMLKPAQDSDYEGFTLESTSNSFGDEYLKNGKGVIVEMSPKEYLERCAYEIFDKGTIESCLGAVDEKVARGYAKKMKDGVKFDLPYLNYEDSGQEGRHRALAAYMAGIDKMPVLLIGRPPKRNFEW